LLLPRSPRPCTLSKLLSLSFTPIRSQRSGLKRCKNHKRTPSQRLSVGCTTQVFYHQFCNENKSTAGCKRKQNYTTFGATKSKRKSQKWQT
jgi:hypothetical protein